ncbi:hypothetical protein ANO14919_029900 [Xylariales sp. No.14919]|nr:hypothetical protein ANO14919_029900 [Xylariales sp. No.14919]
MPAFEMGGVYATILQETYLDFKTVAKNLQVLAYGVPASQTKLIAASESSDIGHATSEAPQPAESTPRNNDEVGSKSDQKQQPLEERPYSWKPIRLTQEYSPTIQGVEDAHSMVRTILVRIMREINILTKFPDAAMNEQRVQPQISPFLFKGFLPVGEHLKKEASRKN